MSYNEQNLVAFLVVAIAIIVIYRDKPQTATVLIVGLGVYLLLAGRLPIGGVGID